MVRNLARLIMPDTFTQWQRQQKRRHLQPVRNLEQ